MSTAPAVITGFKEVERLRLLHKARTNLFWLATDVLGFNLLTREFHQPMMDSMDLQRLEYYRRVQRGASIMNYHEMWARDYYKTTVRQAQAVQDYLIDPTWTNTWWHAVEDMAVEAGVAVGKMFMQNDVLRRLWPDIMPSKRQRKWASASGFRFEANKDKAGSMRMWGATSEATGGHSRGGYLDDIIGLNDIEDSLMPKKRRWYGKTVKNVIRTDIGWIRGTGTHWDVDDIYMDWKRSKNWDVRVRACYEKDGKPDWNGSPVLYTRDQIEGKRAEMSSFEFSCQMMNSPLSDEDRLWDQSAEQFCTFGEAQQGYGVNFVLSDPAPFHAGSLSGRKEKERQDGSKDWWSMAVLRWRVIGKRQDLILMFGDHSQGWRRREGLEVGARLLQRWSTNFFFNEYYGGLGADYTEDMVEVCRQFGSDLFLEGKGDSLRLPRFSDSHASGAKNLRVESLSDLAKRGRFFICETCPAEYLYGDEEHTGFLTQIRKFRALASGRNNLKWDDDADVVSRGTDRGLQKFAPQPFEEEPWQTELAAALIDRRKREIDEGYRCRYFQY